MTPYPSFTGQLSFAWSDVDDVLLDMDGTLLDRHFDNVLFEEELPRRYAAREGLTFEEARDRLFALYRSVESELAWTDLEYWTRRLDIDVVGLHRELDQLITYLPGAQEFLAAVRAMGKRLTLLTNAHPAGVEIKSARTGLILGVDQVITAFDVGYLKMRREYWPECRRLAGFDPRRSVFVDDDEGCLLAAETYGLAHIVHSGKASSQLPSRPSPRFFSITTLTHLLADDPQEAR